MTACKAMAEACQLTTSLCHPQTPACAISKWQVLCSGLLPDGLMMPLAGVLHPADSAPQAVYELSSLPSHCQAKTDGPPLPSVGLTNHIITKATSHGHSHTDPPHTSTLHKLGHTGPLSQTFSSKYPQSGISSQAPLHTGSIMQFSSSRNLFRSHRPLHLGFLTQESSCRHPHISIKEKLQSWQESRGVAGKV